MKEFHIAEGSVIDVLSSQPSNSFDACLTDPPYGLSFMGKAWDGSVPGVEVWAEVLRCLKPGAFLMAFGGTRTHHRLMCAIEDAGFEIRDCCMWLYGSGFPKSLDISKALDKQAGAERITIDTGATRKYGMRGSASNGTAYNGRGDGRPETRTVTAPTTASAKLWDGYGTALKPAWEPIIVAMKPPEGTFAQNAMRHGVAGLSIDAGRITLRPGESPSGSGNRDSWRELEQRNDRPPATAGNITPDTGRWPANLLLDEESAAALDEQSGELTSGARTGHRNSDKTKNAFGPFAGSRSEKPSEASSGGASRFFYTGKASPSERGHGNTHPTVKPAELNLYLAKLILPPERDDEPRRLLVPFSGSGSEIIGALSAGWEYALGIEISPEYAVIARRRIIEDAPLWNTEVSA